MTSSKYSRESVNKQGTLQMALTVFKCVKCLTAYQEKAPDKCRVCGGTSFSELSAEQIGLRMTVSVAIILAFIGFILYINYFEDDSHEKLANPSTQEHRASSNVDTVSYSGEAGFYLLRKDSEAILQAALLEYKPSELLRSVNHACKVIKNRHRRTKKLLTESEALYRKVESVCDTSF